MQRMLDDGVATRRGVMNAHLERPYRSEANRAQLPRSEHAQMHGLILPLVPSMTASQIEMICESLEAALEPVARATRLYSTI
jgi:dTDP-4-amino-4,6-dideoxygalactose transaminase